jgi:hypothetical protein
VLAGRLAWFLTAESAEVAEILRSSALSACSAVRPTLVRETTKISVLFFENYVFFHDVEDVSF